MVLFYKNNSWPNKRSTYKTSNYPFFQTDPLPATILSLLFHHVEQWRIKVRTYFEQHEYERNHFVDELNLITNSFSSFRSSMIKYHDSSLYLCYNVDYPRNYKTVFPKCNSMPSIATFLSCCM